MKLQYRTSMPTDLLIMCIVSGFILFVGLFLLLLGALGRV